MRQKSVSGFWSEALAKLRVLWIYYLGGALTIPLLMLPWILRSRWMRWALLTCGAVVLALLLETWAWPHYAAPIAGLIFVLVVQGLRHIRLWRWQGKPLGPWLVRAILLVAIVAPVWSFALFAWKWHRYPRPYFDPSLERVQLLAEFERKGGQHLVIVRYGPVAQIHFDWVHNRADIAAAPVVWAHEMAAPENARLLEYFKNRRVWLLEADIHTARLSSWPKDP